MALWRWEKGGIAQDSELPPVLYHERSSVILTANSSSSPKLPSEWLLVLDMLAGTKDFVDWGNGSVG